MLNDTDRFGRGEPLPDAVETGAKRNGYR